MQADQLLSFGAYRLDPRNARLWRGRQLIALTPKAFAVLCHLVEHAGQLVTKDALLTAVWPEIYVSEGVLSECVREVRKALGDTPQAPRFIQTAHRRGYRFIEKVVSSQQPVARRRKQRNGNWPLATHLVGRETELAQLQKWLKRVLGGARQLVFVTGEAGIGKTTVVDAFVTHLSARSPVWIGRGQCIDHYGQGEAYLPVLEALGRMCRKPEGKHLIDLLSQHAPTWLVQMPALLTTAELEALQRRTQGATRERMLRELAEAMEVLTTERPLVLWFEDLQWSDVSTLDWLTFVARRREPARLLIMGTYRPVEVIVSNHSLKSVKQELQLHGQCVELPLTFLTEEDVSKYLVRRFASPSPASAGKGQGKDLTSATLHKLAHLIHQRTEGNPLFMVNLVDYLVTQGVLARIDGQWRLQGDMTALTSWAPESLRQMIEKQIERLSPRERRVLEVASVAGAEFSAAAVAAGLEIEVDAAEEQCEGLARREQFLRARGAADWPDGTVAARYGFLHALYQDVLYDRLTARQQQRLHQQIGERVEQAYGERAREIATELAMHFERGRDYRRAVQYLQQAGENAARRSAHHEAIALLTKGLELLKALPDTPERIQQELALQVTLGPLLAMTKGAGSPEVGKVYTRGLELCRQVEDTPRLFEVLVGLCGFHNYRGELQTSLQLAEQLLGVAQRAQHPFRLMYAHMLVADCLHKVGELALARTHAEQTISLSDSQPHRLSASPHRLSPGVLARSVISLSLWTLGYPEQALRRIHEALTLAREFPKGHTLANVLDCALRLHTLRREWQATQALAEELIALAAEQGLHGLFYGTFIRGRALAEQGQEEGIVQMRQTLAPYRATGSEWGYAHLLALLAESCGKAGNAEEGLNMLAEAFTVLNKIGQRPNETGLYRLKGELLLMQESENQRAKGKNYQSPTPNSQAEAEACFRKAIEIARKQQAKSPELRATMSLARLWRNQGKRKEAHKLLVEIYGWFTEGFDTKDLQEAKALLDELIH